MAQRGKRRVARKKMRATHQIQLSQKTLAVIVMLNSKHVHLYAFVCCVYWGTAKKKKTLASATLRSSSIVRCLPRTLSLDAFIVEILKRNMKRKKKPNIKSGAHRSKAKAER